MAITTPKGEQIQFVSAKTGTHNLDTYLEAAEVGNRQLHDLLDDLFDSSTGVFKADNFQFRFDTSTDKLQVRVGQYSSSTAGWTDVTTFFKVTGTFSTSTSYNNFDLVTLSTKDVYIVHGLTTATAYSSESNFISSANTEKLVDVSEARDWAIKTDGQVSSTDYSSKAWAIGGTGVTDTASKGAAKEWATKTSGTVDGSDYSAKHWATTGSVAAVSGSIGNINNVSSYLIPITNVADNITSVNALAATDVLADMALLAVSDVISDMNVLATADVVSDMNTLATSDIVNDMNVLGTFANVTNMNTLAGISASITTVAGKASLITSDFVSDLNALAVTDVINDINLLATSDIVSDLNLLATSDIISDLNTLATSDIVSDINVLATSDIVSDLNQLATSDFVSDLNAMATTANINNLNTVSGSISNVNTVATNISSVNDFADKYRIGSSDPSSSNDAGDLFYNTSTNALKVYTGSAWENGVTAGSGFLATSGGTMTGNLALGDNVKATFGNSGDLEVFHDGSNSFITDGGTGNLMMRAGDFTMQNPDGSETLFEAVRNGAVKLWYDAGTYSNPKLQTTASGISVTGNATFADNGKASFGDSDDLQIFHDGSNSFIKEDGTGVLKIQAADLELLHADGSRGIRVTNDGGPVLYNDGSSKLTVNSGGVAISGNITVTGTVDGRDIATNIPSSLGSAGQVLTVNSGGSAAEWAAAGGGADLYTANESSPDAQPSATGTNAVAIGDSSEASGTRSTALGKGIAAGIESAAVGPAYAGGASSFAAGISTNGSSYGATSSGAIALGQNAKASYFRATAIGEYAIASGNRATAIGRSATSAGSLAFAGGGNSRADGDYSVALGQSFANGENSFAAGIGVTDASKGAMNINSVAIGQNANAGWNNSLAIGISATTGAANQIALGGTSNQVKISGTYTLPTSDGSANQVLTTNGSGVVSFAAAGGGADLYAANESSPANQPSATGGNAIGIGDTAQAAGADGVAIGLQSYARAQSALGLFGDAQNASSVAIGTGSSASADRAVALGANGSALGTQAVSLGKSRATGASSIAGSINQNSSSYGTTGVNTVAFGTQAKATNNSAVSIGQSSIASGYQSAAYGYNAVASGQDSLGLGTSTHVLGQGSVAIGIGDASYGVLSGADYSIAIGKQARVRANVDYSIAIGYSTDVNNTTSTAIGYNASAFGVGSLGVGLDAYAGNDYALALGKGSYAGNGYSSAIGANSSTQGSTTAANGAMALGGSYASGTDSFAAAIATNSSSYGANYQYSIAMGRNSKASGNYATGIGYNVTASGSVSVAMGDRAQATGSGSICLAAGGTGWGASATGASSVTIGDGAIARGRGKFSFASGNTAVGSSMMQSGQLTISLVTTNNTPAGLNSWNYGAAGADNQLLLPNNSAFAFHGTIVARQKASEGTACAAWRIEGLIRKEGSAGTTVLVNSATTVLDNTPNWGMALSADTSNGALKVQATGASSTNIRWTGTLYTSEVTYA